MVNTNSREEPREDHHRNLNPNNAHPCCISSASTHAHTTCATHLAALSLKVWHRHSPYFRLICRRSPKCSYGGQNCAASIEVDRGSGVLGCHCSILNTLQVADDTGEISHQDCARVDSCFRERRYLHQSCQLHRLIFCEDNGRRQLCFIFRIVLCVR
jgi:hypothetical protein